MNTMDMRTLVSKNNGFNDVHIVKKSELTLRIEGANDTAECPIQTYHRSKDVSKKITVRNAIEAERVAKFYINDDVYLNVDPERMYHIAMQLKSYVKTPSIKKGLDCIIEVCEPSVSEVITLKSRI